MWPSGIRMVFLCFICLREKRLMVPRKYIFLLLINDWLRIVSNFSGFWFTKTLLAFRNTEKSKLLKNCPKMRLREWLIFPEHWSCQTTCRWVYHLRLSQPFWTSSNCHHNQESRYTSNFEIGYSFGKKSWDSIIHIYY